MTFAALDASLRRLTGRADEPRVSIEDWLGKPDERRKVEFTPAEKHDQARNGGKPWQCELRQHSHGYISVAAFGHTTAEAFWAAIDDFQRITGGIYRSGK
jgi:hypothetical protein